MSADFESIISSMQQNLGMRNPEAELKRLLQTLLYEKDLGRLLNIKSVDNERYCFVTRRLQYFYQTGRRYVDEEMKHPLLDERRKVPSETLKYLLTDAYEYSKELEREKRWRELKKRRFISL